MTGRPLDAPERLRAIQRANLLNEMSRPARERVSRLITHVTGAPLTEEQAGVELSRAQRDGVPVSVVVSGWRPGASTA